MSDQKPRAGIEASLEENRLFPPPPDFAAKAAVHDRSVYAQAERDPEGYWAAWARKLDWFLDFETVLEGDAPDYRWFPDGKLNVAVNCLDRHVDAGLGEKVALHFEGEPGDTRTLTYSDLLREVCRAANGLRSLGVGKGDRVAVYLPMVPELAIALLACARIGAIHSVVFGGFSADSLRDRINDSGCKVLVTADAGWRRGHPVPLKATSDEALAATPTIEKVVVLERAGVAHEMVGGRDIPWSDLVDGQPEECPPEWMDSEDVLFILYTSGTTGKPKGIVHTTGGYLTGVFATTRLVFDLKDDDVFWCTADIGWITGHSYLVYGPMSQGATQVMYEGAPDWPDRARFWRLIEKYGVTIFYTAPTAIRAFMKWGDEFPAQADLGSLRLLGTVGEPINPEAWTWYHRTIGGGRCPVVDTWWQTETGHIMISPLPGVTTLRPGSATHPLPGISVELRTEAGEVVEEGGGYLALNRPWPGMLRGIWGDPERFLRQYWSFWDDRVYFTGDGAKRDAEGYIVILGRVDDVISVSGHRIGTMEVESAIVEHPAVAEAAVVGRKDDITGEAICAFIILRDGYERSPELQAEVQDFVGRKIGRFARPKEVLLTADLPKTRSGKIMRRLLRDIAEGRALGDITTLADPGVVQSLKERYQAEG
jgi:acetyl-CoA synthetase